MRVASLFLSLFAFASATAAQAAPDTSGIERALRDPATAQKLDRSLDAMTDALLDLKVGGIEAAIEGRPATAQEKATTVRDLERRKGRNPDQLRAQIRSAGPAIANSMNVLADALPAMTRALDDIERAVDKAVANMPDPTYPRR